MSYVARQQILGRYHCSPSLSLPGSNQPGYLHAATLCSRQQTPRTTGRSTRLTVESRYRGRGTDLSKVQQFMRSETDTGSTEVQIAQLSARISQLTTHLQEHRKDHASKRGLEALLSRRRHFMQYLYSKDRAKYDKIIVDLKIRPLRIQAGRGVVVKATEEGLVVEPEMTQAGDSA